MNHSINPSIRGHRFLLWMAFAVFLLLAVAEPAGARSVVLISVDGMRPDYITRADQLGLKAPNLRRMMKEGAYAEGVKGVVPTVTYPSHTTLITGVSPAIHGIYSNTTFDPEQENLHGWYWYSQDIKVPTLWDIAKAAGLSTASVNWPVSVGAKVDYLIPEVWRAGTEDDRKLVRALSTPGMLARLEAELGPYAEQLNVDVPNDRLRAKFAIAILQKYKPKLITVHLAALDHVQHQYGPFSPEANSVLEASDELVGKLWQAALSADPQAIVCVVSDHGFAPVHQKLNLFTAFVQQGLIRPGSGKTPLGAPKIESWDAMPWTNGGSAAIVLRNPNDVALINKTRDLLNSLAADPGNGINRIVEAKELRSLGGYPTASFLVDMKPGFQTDTGLTGPLLLVGSGGTHGYLPEHVEMLASFFLTGRGIAHARNLGVVDMRQIAPTLANLLGLKIPAAETAPLQVRTGP
jgi:predicted AlkP superfamily pyrophosphatase or phosphodiesterase